MRRDNERVNRSYIEHSATTEFRLRCKKIAEVDAIWRMCEMDKPSAEKVRAGQLSVLASANRGYVRRGASRPREAADVSA
jgi:hypothetical protein